MWSSFCGRLRLEYWYFCCGSRVWLKKFLSRVGIEFYYRGVVMMMVFVFWSVCFVLMRLGLSVMCCW